MKITPLEIRQHVFEKSMRGYNKDEVHAYLLSLSQEWEKLIEENKDLKTSLSRSEKDVEKLREVEASLFKTLKTAEDTGANMVEQAKKESELIMKEAQMNADALLNEAKQQAKNLIEEAESKSKNTLLGMKDELLQMEASYRTLQNDKENVLLDLKNLASTIVEKVEKFGGDKTHVFTEARESAVKEIRSIEDKVQRQAVIEEVEKEKEPLPPTEPEPIVESPLPEQEFIEEKKEPEPSQETMVEKIEEEPEPIKKTTVVEEDVIVPPRQEKIEEMEKPQPEEPQPPINLSSEPKPTLTPRESIIDNPPKSPFLTSRANKGQISFFDGLSDEE